MPRSGMSQWREEEETFVDTAAWLTVKVACGRANLGC
jgi:hypothetical protein